MNYYEVEFTLKVVKEYLGGLLGGRALAKKYGLFSNTLIYNWKHSYQLIEKKNLKHIEHQKNILMILSEVDLHFIETTGTSHGEVTRWFKIPRGSMNFSLAKRDTH